MAENNKDNVVDVTEEKKGFFKGFFKSFKEHKDSFPDRHPKITKFGHGAKKVVGAGLLILGGAFLGGVAVGMKEELRKSKAPEEAPVEETENLLDPEFEELVATEEAEEAPEEEAPITEQAEEE